MIKIYKDVNKNIPYASDKCLEHEELKIVKDTIEL